MRLQMEVIHLIDEHQEKIRFIGMKLDAHHIIVE